MEPAPTPHGGVDCAVHLDAYRDVDLLEERLAASGNDLLGGVGGCVALHVDAQDAPALLAEAYRDGSPDAGAGSSDEANLPGHAAGCRGCHLAEPPDITDSAESSAG
jgi:hypothetical protein